MKNSINDWSEYLLWAEKNFKDLEHKLLHNNYEGWQENIAAIRQSLDKTSEWIKAHAEQK
jgi:hypothetical protein